MSLQYAVLALVLERRGYGYDLAQRLEERVGPAWRLNPSAVYPALDQLERAGFVTGVARARGTRRSPRVVYSATPAGAAALDTWLSTTVTAPEPVRSELHLRLAFARERDRERLLAQLTAQRDACEELLARYAERTSSTAPDSRWIDAAVVARLQAELAALDDTRAALAPAEPAAGDAQSDDGDTRRASGSARPRLEPAREQEALDDSRNRHACALGDPCGERCDRRARDPVAGAGADDGAGDRVELRLAAGGYVALHRRREVVVNLSNSP